MQRWAAITLIVSVAGIVGLACNSIAGIDGIDTKQCSVSSECPNFGECTVESCDDGVCQYALAPAGEPCSRGICDGKARCVECIGNDDCADDGTPLLCTGDGRCIECFDHSDCKFAPRTTCSNGSCVQCVDITNCVLPTEPMECIESACLGGVCALQYSLPGTPCNLEDMMKKWICDGLGSCTEVGP